MPRQKITLTDDQGRALVRALAPILARHPAQAGSHRPFVRDFIRAVHAATGCLYSPTIYRRFLHAYAPGRNPSSDTIEQEKAAFAAELDHASAGTGGATVDAAGAPMSLSVLSLLVEQAVDRAIGRSTPPTSAAASGERVLQAQLDFLQAQLVARERQLADSQAKAAHLAAQCLAADESNKLLRSALDAERARCTDLVTRLAGMEKEVAGVRAFALQAIDGVRGETRAWQERCEALKQDVKRRQFETEVFRRLAYARGAAIPPEIEKGDE
jgi:hypothetical protein